MKEILQIILFVFPTLLFGQKNMTNEPWEIGCDTVGGTQLEMNICSYESYLIADSILTELNKELTKYFETDLMKERGFIDSPKDSIQIDYVNVLESQLTAFKKSINDFYEYRKNISEVMRFQYYGGTISPLVVNTYALSLTVNQIATMRIMIEEIKK